MNYTIDIDSSASIVFTNDLEKLRKSALPIAVRSTLNKAAFNVKQVTMPESADKHFVKRKPNFFKANSRVFMATGWNVGAMESTVGFISSNLQHNNQSVKELQQQEYGGEIQNRDYVPLDTSRQGNSSRSMVKPVNRLARLNLSKVVDVKKASGVSGKQKFIKSAVFAGKGGLVKAGLGRKEILYRINKISREGNNTVISKTPIYSYQDGRDVDIKPEGFMREASYKSAKRLPEFYEMEAERQINKVFSK
jgi:hypothetical protein